jgi:hypothetical protein
MTPRMPPPRAQGSRAMRLRALLPLAAPLVAGWARWHEKRILARGEPLAADEAAMARAAGVREPQRIRVLRVERIPIPATRTLAWLAHRAGLPGPDVDGMTLGHGIYLCMRAGAPARLLAHECRHVYQYERAGSVRAFIAEYLHEVAAFGYRDAPLEADARHFASGNAGCSDLCTPADKSDR